MREMIQDADIRIARARMESWSIDRIRAMYRDRMAPIAYRLAAEQIINLHFAP